MRLSWTCNLSSSPSSSRQLALFPVREGDKRWADVTQQRRGSQASSSVLGDTLIGVRTNVSTNGAEVGPLCRWPIRGSHSSWGRGFIHIRQASLSVVGGRSLGCRLGRGLDQSATNERRPASRAGQHERSSPARLVMAHTSCLACSHCTRRP